MRNTVKFTQVTLGLVPEIFNAIDVVFTGGKELGMVDPPMPETGHREGIVAGQGIAIDDGIGHIRALMMGSSVVALALAMTTA